MRDDFTLDGYAALVTRLRDEGYESVGFAEAEPAKTHLILRHDIDMSVDLAVALAEREAELGMRGTYFALLRSELYNAFSERSRAGLRRLVELGHDVGLHLDAALYEPSRDALEAACAEECELLERCTGREVRIVSFHRPAEALLGSAEPLAGRRHAYEPRFFREMGYCSDSRGDWHHGHPLEHDAVREGRALQLLTHPIWWVAHPGEAAVARLDRLVLDHTEAYRRDIAAHCEIYR